MVRRSLGIALNGKRVGTVTGIGRTIEEALADARRKFRQMKEAIKGKRRANPKKKRKRRKAVKRRRKKAAKRKTKRRSKKRVTKRRRTRR